MPCLSCELSIPLAMKDTSSFWTHCFERLSCTGAGHAECKPSPWTNSPPQSRLNMLSDLKRSFTETGETEMKSNYRINLILGLAAILSAGLLQGADCVGSFTLPHQTNWGMAVLPAGDYQFRLTVASEYQSLRLSRGTSVVNMVMPLNGSSTGTSGASSISIVGNRVRGFHLAP